jgi:hypothetical protein
LHDLSIGAALAFETTKACFDLLHRKFGARQ